jgi:hypothetical protein
MKVVLSGQLHIQSLEPVEASLRTTRTGGLPSKNSLETRMMSGYLCTWLLMVMALTVT